MIYLMMLYAALGEVRETLATFLKRGDDSWTPRGTDKPRHRALCYVVAAGSGPTTVLNLPIKGRLFLRSITYTTPWWSGLASDEFITLNAVYNGEPLFALPPNMGPSEIFTILDGGTLEFTLTNISISDDVALINICAFERFADLRGDNTDE